MDKVAEQARFQKAWKNKCNCVHVCIVFLELTKLSCESLCMRRFLAALTVPHENPVIVTQDMGCRTKRQ